MISNELDEFEIFVTVYIIGGSLVGYQIGYVVDRCPRRQFQTLISKIMPMNSNIKEFENLSVEKKTLSTALGFEPRSCDCRSTALTTELHRRPTYNSPQEDLLISPSGSALRL